MSQIYKISKSRDSWKEKAKSRGKQVRDERREKKRLQKKIEGQVCKIKELEEKIKCGIPHPVMPKEQLIFITLQLFLVCGVGFRATSRVLALLAPLLGIKRSPSYQTVINWLLRLSIVKMEKAALFKGPKLLTQPFTNGLIWMIDISIGIGQEKILSVVGVPIDHHKNNTGAIALKDTCCMGVGVQKSWTGELIAEFLTKIIAVCGRPVAYLKDGGTDLGKSTRLLIEQGIGSPVISDISHYCANLLKKDYEKHPFYIEFITLCGIISKKFKQSILACMAPPTISNKARFMNVHILFKWAQKILMHSPVGRSANESILSKFRECIGTLPAFKVFIEIFLRDATALLKCQEILKKKGVNEETHELCMTTLNSIPKTSDIYKGMKEWLDENLELAKLIGSSTIGGLPITTDAIESLFGIGKIRGTGPVKDAFGIGVRLPTFLGELTLGDVKLIKSVTVERQNEIFGDTTSVHKQRRAILTNPELINELEANEFNNIIELIPLSKKQKKADNIATIKGTSKIVENKRDTFLQKTG